MKKLALVLAIALIAAFSAPAFAGEFTLNGTYRMTAVNTDTGVTGTDADEAKNFQQRFRLPFAWKVNDNVSAYMRTDWTEQNTTGGSIGWGNGNALGASDSIQIDYAWVKISQPVFDLIVGAQEVMLANWSVLDIDQEGFTLNLKFNPVLVTLAYGKLSEDSSKRDDGDNADADSYAAQVQYSGQGFNVGAFYAKAVDSEPAFDDEKIGYGLYINGTMGAWGYKAELDIFDGEQNATTDYAGMNLWADVSYKVSDVLTLGLAGYYGDGNNDATETQLSSVSSTGYSFQIWDYDFNSALMIDEFPQLSGDNFDMATDAGLQAIKGYVRFKATPEITLYGMLGYATPEENVNLDSKTYAVGSVDYAWMPNVVVSVGAAYIEPDYASTATIDEACIQYMARLGVTF
ncbi:MAG: porin [Desulfobacula sp.]|jgi:hypothetical protein